MHATGQENITDLQGQVDMVGHKAKCINAVTESACPFLKQEVKTVAIFVIQEYGLAAITSKNDVVKSA